MNYQTRSIIGIIEVTDGRKRLFIKDDLFYILRSKEKLHVPKGIAIIVVLATKRWRECDSLRWIRPSLFRLYREWDAGKPLIFEVRGTKFPLVSVMARRCSLSFIGCRDPVDLDDEQKKKEAKGYGSQDLNFRLVSRIGPSISRGQRRYCRENKGKGERWRS